MDETASLAIQNPDFAPSFIVRPEEAARNIEELQRFVQSQMVKGQDYGTIPGTDKPTLLKPGAERLCEMYGYAISAQVTHRIEDWERGHFSYEVRCDLIHKRTGVLVASGVGSCNSMESRYRYRWVWPENVPEGVNKASLVTRKTKTGITQYRMVNDDPYSLVNTLLKMAKKRALVDAALSATRSSGIFTQDIEDMAAEDTSHGTTPPNAPAKRSAQGGPTPRTQGGEQGAPSEQGQYEHTERPPAPGQKKASQAQLSAVWASAYSAFGKSEAKKRIDLICSTSGLPLDMKELATNQAAWLIDEIKTVEAEPSMGNREQVNPEIFGPDGGGA